VGVVVVASVVVGGSVVVVGASVVVVSRSVVVDRSVLVGSSLVIERSVATISSSSSGEPAIAAMTNSPITPVTTQAQGAALYQGGCDGGSPAGGGSPGPS
jgi:hypothetical protein